MTIDRCPVCASPLSESDPRSIPYPTTSQTRSRQEVPSAIRFCATCAIGVAFPPISDEASEQLYAEGAYWGKTGFKPRAKFLPVPFRLAQERWRTIERAVADLGPDRPVRVLDIGAGHGYVGLVAAASRAVSLEEYIAVEPDPAMRQYLESMWKNRGHPQKLTLIDSMDRAAETCDVVVLSHILEHVSDPVSFLESARARLAPQGLLFVDVPHQDCLFKRDVFPHVLFFSERSLKFLLEKTGMDIVSFGVWGRNMYRSPTCFKAPKYLRVLGKTVGRVERFLPDTWRVVFYDWFYGISKPDANGTWIRVLCRQA